MKSEIEVRNLSKKTLKEVWVGNIGGLASLEDNKWVLSPGIRSFQEDVLKKLPAIEKASTTSEEPSTT